MAQIEDAFSKLLDGESIKHSSEYALSCVESVAKLPSSPDDDLIDDFIEGIDKETNKRLYGLLIRGFFENVERESAKQEFLQEYADALIKAHD